MTRRGILAAGFALALAGGVGAASALQPSPGPGTPSPAADPRTSGRIVGPGAGKEAVSRALRRSAGAASSRSITPQSADVPSALFMIDFEFDSDRLTPAGKELVDVIVAVISEDPELRAKSYLVDGHTDAYGGAAYNKRLSQRRADAVARALQRSGVAPDRTLARSFGASRPVEGADPYDDVNRRVEITPVDLR